MEKFDIMICSRRQVQDFVALAARQPFRITVGNENQSIDGKDFMGMFSLDYSKPLQVSVQCSQEESCRFQQSIAMLLI